MSWFSFVTSAPRSAATAPLRDELADQPGDLAEISLANGLREEAEGTYGTAERRLRCCAGRG